MSDTDMPDPEVLAVASDLRLVVGTLVRRLRLHRDPDDPTVPETAVLARLDREGPATSADLARREQVSPQSMGVTVAALQERGLVDRARDPDDGRRVVLSLTPDGADALAGRRNARTRVIAEAMGTLDDADRAALTAAMPILERLAAAL